MPRLNPLVADLAPPPIPSVQAWARAYDGSLGPTVDLSQAVPGYPPHPELIALLRAAAANPSTAAYGPIEGERALRDALAADESTLYGAAIAADNIHITAGCNQAFICAALAVAEPGSRVLLSNPFYFNHETSLRMFGVGIGLVDCPAEGGFLPSLEALDEAITPDVRAFAVVSPNNPTGAVYPPALLADLLELCRRRGIWLILDETYRDFLPAEARRPHDLFLRSGWGDGLISLYSFSKSFCVPGYRLGAVTASPAVVAEIAKIMDNLQICAPRVGQIAVAEALPRLGAWRETNRAEITLRANALKAAIAQADGWEIGAVGAYFAFVRHPFAGVPSARVAEELARRPGIVTVPGSYFGPGQDGYLRFAFANATAPTIGLLPARLAQLGTVIGD
ncbi:Histidinol-phosphate aminotransferase [Pleomorphomonas sp. T1.2MG-36]|uniref:aminotransferase n=1 Tax=Pleomorphomonas sp. T1.2MG-36 TaxID=3041167 RepID=UPI0024778F52|nr:aminotransferase [Pleomorphomonas sp. T1.2MG-36]CAI9412633.1 Histidinol-phosphate aminotransferase [Pleomorphomonas sp. T1.2MG-36]